MFVFFQNFNKRLDIWPRECENQNLKEIHALGSEIINATTDWRTDDGRKNFDFMSSADIVKQS